MVKCLIEKDAAEKWMYYHLFTMNEEMYRKIHRYFTSENISIFGDNRLENLFNMAYRLKDYGDLSELKHILATEVKNRSKNGALKGIDDAFLEKVYKNRQNTLDLVKKEQENGKLEPVLEKLWLKKQKLEGKMPDFSKNDDDDDDFIDDYVDEVKLTPIIDDFVYDNLPPVIKKMIDYIGKDARKKDIFLISLFPTLSILFNNFEAHMARDDGSQERILTNLYTFIISSASSGKGVFRYLNDVLWRYLEEVRLYNERKAAEIEAYNIDIEDIKKKDKHADYSLIEFKPYIPLIPGNISNAVFKKTLENNRGRGLIIEEEIDNLVKNNRSEWGNISEDLRSAFHQEPIKDMRLGRGMTKIENPFLSLAGSGTLDQLQKIFYVNNSLQNGLFSRFLFYYNNDDNYEYNYFTSSKTEYKENPIKEISNYLYELHNYYRKTEKIYIDISGNQVSLINSIINKLYNKMMNTHDADFRASFNRASLMIIKIATLLSIVRRGLDGKNVLDMDADSGHDVNKFSITDLDIQIAGSIYETLLNHISWVYTGAKSTSENIKEKSGNIVQNPSKNPVEVAYEALTKTFKKKDLISIMSAAGSIKADRDVDKYIHKWLLTGKIIKSETRGYYNKK